jgi:hypothetical protein
MIVATHGIIGSSIVSVDTDALAFITAASITDTTQKNAVNQLVLDLKSYGLWTKMKAIYPFIGGTASSHKFNLKDPRDLDAAFRLQFNGGGTHSANGYAGNATNAWANTFMNAQSVLTNSNLHVSFYSRTAQSSQDYSNEIAVNGTYSSSNWLSLRTNNKTGGFNSYFVAGSDSVSASVSNTSSGFFIGSETASNLRKLYQNGSVTATNTTSDTNSLPSLQITLLGSSINSNNYSGNQSAFASIGDGLTDTEAANLYTAIQAYQTTLGRQV